MDRPELYQKLSDMLVDANVTEDDLYDIADFILDNFEPRGGGQDVV